MNEIWKDIKEYPGYQASNLGRIRTNNKVTITKRHGERHWKNRILKPKKLTNKYGRSDYRVELWRDGKHKTFLVARLVALTFNDLPLETKLTINHIDCNTLNNNIDNLEIVSREENIRQWFNTNFCKYQKNIKITNKTTGEIKYLTSMAKGCSYIKRTHSYLSTKIKNNIFEDNDYKWELI